MSKQSELDEILSRHGAEAGEMTHSLKQALLDWHNKQIEEALDRLESQKVNRNIISSTQVYEDTLIPLSAIEAERNKLKESTDV